MVKNLYILFLCIIGFTVNAMDRSSEIRNELQKKIDEIIKKEPTQNQAIISLRNLEANPQYEPYFQSYEFMKALFSHLSKKYSILEQSLENIWDKEAFKAQAGYPGTYIGNLPLDLQKELNKYGLQDIVQKINQAKNRQEYLPYLFKLKRFREKNAALFKEPITQELLKPVFERIDEVDFDPLVKLFNAENKVKEWRNLECDLIKAVDENDLNKVKELVEKYKVNREASLLNMREVKSDFCHKFRYKSSCQFYPICYASIFNRDLDQYLRNGQLSIYKRN